jgi:hypothetical protein
MVMGVVLSKAGVRMNFMFFTLLRCSFWFLSTHLNTDGGACGTATRQRGLTRHLFGLRLAGKKEPS